MFFLLRWQKCNRGNLCHPLLSNISLWDVLTFQSFVLQKLSTGTLQNILFVTAWPKKRGLFWERLPQHYGKMLHLLTHRLSLFSDLLHHEVLGAHLSPLGRSFPSGIQSTLAGLTHLCFRVWSAVYFWIISAFIFLQSEHENIGLSTRGDCQIHTNPKGAEEQVTESTQTPLFLMGQWYIELSGWLQMLIIEPVINEREMIALPEIP